MPTTVCEGTHQNTNIVLRIRHVTNGEYFVGRQELKRERWVGDNVALLTTSACVARLL